MAQDRYALNHRFDTQIIVQSECSIFICTEKKYAPLLTCES